MVSRKPVPVIKLMMPHMSLIKSAKGQLKSLDSLATALKATLMQLASSQNQLLPLVVKH